MARRSAPTRWRGRAELGWPYPPFEIPPELLAVWRGFGVRGAPVRAAWEGRLARQPAEVRAEFERAQAGTLPPGLDGVLRGLKQRFAEEQPTWATRKASQEVLEAFTPAVPELVGGSADLTGSVNTKTAALQPMTPETPGGRYIHFGVREHAMAAAMNGMALHRGVIPYGGTFLIFSDYCRPAIRLAALMGQRVIFVLTHDPIGLGEDGPTHQPIEHLAALRAMPGLFVFRPADAVETAECWASALVRADGPSALVLTRQGLPALRTTADEVNRRPRRLRARAGGRPPHGHAARDRLGSVDRRAGAQTPAGVRRRLRGGLDAVLRAVRPAGRDLPQGSAGRRASGSRSRRHRRSAGRATCARRTTWSACAASARRGRPRRCTHTSASRPSAWSSSCASGSEPKPRLAGARQLKER